MEHVKLGAPALAPSVVGGRADDGGVGWCQDSRDPRVRVRVRVRVR